MSSERMKPSGGASAPSVSRGSALDDPEVMAAVEAYLVALQEGKRPDRGALAAKFPEIAAELSECLDAMEFVHQAAPQPGDEAPPPSPGEPLGRLGDFRISREIGRGGMGVVYEAQQISLGRRVALKVLPFASMLDPRQLVRFQNEARAAATLDHPNIVGIYSVGCERGVHYYAMQYIEGRTLAQVIEELRASSPLPRAGEGSGVRAADGSAERGFPDVAGRASPDPAQTPPEGLPDAVADVGCVKRTDSEADDEAVRSTHPTDSPDTDRQHQAAISTKGPHQSAEFFRTVARLGIQAAEALDHAHQSGVVHRDIKPSNLMVGSLLPSPTRGRGASDLPSPSGRGVGGEGGAADTLHLWITDFGLAMTQADPGMTATGDVLGTLRYMSPEQSQGDRRRMDHRTDIYSLGVTLYELVTLRPAFPGDDRETVLRQLSEEDPPSPRRLNPSTPRDLETIILKAMAKDPSRRYGTAQELADDLKRFLAHEPIRARRPTLADRAAKWSRRHRPVVWSAVILLVIVTVATAGMAWNGYRRSVQLASDVGEHLAAAGAFLQSADYSAADRELANARGRLDSAGYGEGPLAEEVDRLTEELSAKRQAIERFDEFQKLRHRIHSEMYAVDQTVLDQAQEHCRTALGMYGVLEGDSWKQQPRIQNLSPERQAGLDEGVVELLFIRAWLPIDRSKGKPPEERDAFHRSAIEAFSKINDIRGPIPAVHLWMAESQEALGQKTAAEQSRAKAGSLRSATAMDYFLLGQYHARHGRPEEALAAYWQALAEQPDHYVSLLAAGVVLGELKRHESAEAMLTGAIAMNPQTVLAYVRRASSRESLGKVLSAEADLRKACNLDSALGLNLAQRPVYRGDPDKVIAECNEEIRLDPRKATAYSQRGHEWIVKGDWDRAIADCSEAIRLDPRCFAAYGNRSTVFNVKGEYDKAILDLSEAVRIDPKECSIGITPNEFSTAYANRGLAYIQKGDWKSALADIDRALELDKDDATAQQAAALHMAFSPDRQAWKPARSIEVGKRAVAIAPKDPESWMRLGVAHYRAGNHQAAIDALEKAIELRRGATSSEGMFLAMALWKSGNKEEARRVYDQTAGFMDKEMSDRAVWASLRPLPREAGIRFRAEATELLGIEKNPPAAKEKSQKAK